MLLTLTLAAVLSAGLVGIVRWDAHRRGLIDRPNARSSHSIPTPRGGGLGLVLAVGGALLFQFDMAWAPVPVLLAAAAVIIVAVVGWVDDHGGAPVRVRLAVHLAAGALVLPLVLGAELPLPIWLAVPWWVFWTVSSVNVVNFIDGIDGIVGLQTLLYGGFVALLAEPGGGAQVAGAALAGASAGFLAWNWNPARIFMGDVGSGALGVLLVVSGAALVAEGRVGFVAAFSPLAPMFLDAALTLVARARRGERLSEAHRSHLYQRLANGRWGHARVSTMYGALAMAAAAGGAAAPHGGVGLLVALLAGLALVWRLLERAAAAVPADPPVLP